MPSVISGDANVSATEFGFLDGVTSALQTQIDAKLPLAGGKILQIVRATDSTLRSTTSTTYVDVTGMSVTITPQKSDSAVLIIAAFNAATAAFTQEIIRGQYRIADSSNNAISGVEDMFFGVQNLGVNVATSAVSSGVTLIAYATPATTSAVTYKLRFKCGQANTFIYAENNNATGQMYAIEVSA